MRVLIVGRENDPSLEKVYAEHLSSTLGVENVKIFPAQDKFLDYYHASFKNKIIFRLGFEKIYRQINQGLLLEVENYRPDIIWFFKGMEIFPETLKTLKTSYNIPLFNFNPDNPFLFSGLGSGNKNVTKSISLFDHHFTYERTVKAKLEMMSLSTSLLPFGFNITNEVYNKAIEAEEVNKVCFVGNPDKYRAGFLKALVRSGIKVDVYGSTWDKFNSGGDFNIFSPVLNEHFYITLRKYRVQLNMMRPHNPDTHNMRTFEIAGIGGIQLAPDTLDHRVFFDDNKEIFLYKSLEDCIEKIHKILSFSQCEAEKYRTYAREKSIEANYSYNSRAQQVIEVFKTF